MNNVKIEKIQPILADERGFFFEIINNLDIKHIIVTTFRKNAIRGNQFRSNMDQYFFLISGKTKLVLQSPQNNNKKEIEMTQGSFIFIPRGMAFATIAEEESILLECSPQSYDPKNPDIHRFKVI